MKKQLYSGIIYSINTNLLNTSPEDAMIKKIKRKYTDQKMCIRDRIYTHNGYHGHCHRCCLYRKGSGSISLGYLPGGFCICGGGKSLVNGGHHLVGQCLQVNVSHVIGGIQPAVPLSHGGKQGECGQEGFGYGEHHL